MLLYMRFWDFRFFLFLDYSTNYSIKLLGLVCCELCLFFSGRDEYFLSVDKNLHKLIIRQKKANLISNYLQEKI